MKNLLSHINKTKDGGVPAKLNKKLVTFIFCVLVSIFFWLLMTLSKEYSKVFSFPVNYLNAPVDKVISNQLPQTIEIEVKASGYSILAYKLKNKQKEIWIDLKDAKPLSQKNHFFILTNSRIDKLKIQFSNDIVLTKVNPDTIYLNYNRKEEKLVPVIHHVKVNCDKQFQLIDSVKILPSIVKIAGAIDVIDLIDKIETEPLELNNVIASKIIELKIKRTKQLENVDVIPSIIKAKIDVAKYTEATVSVPVQVENLPSNLILKTFPDNVSIKYNVAFSDYEKINASLFKVVVDYKKIEQNDNKLKLQLIEYPNQIKSIKLDPEKVEYIIRKK